ncbi:IPExxxVDY family protein [uncultured Tenacibaculum sp.]|uniref:IPExxxVDY family protein n=1 Tax=uncultured Tenacibaculum sp. TaxID=174713 RepID=UPI002636E118|nr:IPExxxVDY family protein [uncultured Tenacibaculum sp.]
MQAYSLEINDFWCAEYTLIGIHTPLNDYKLAYKLNQSLDVRLVRASYELDFEDNNNKSAYPIFDYIDKELDNNWFLITNVFKEKRKTDGIGLFEESYFKTYLIPEKKKVDYFLKIEGDLDYDFIVKMVDKINQIPQILTSYTIDSETLKSKENLIF